MGGHTAAAPCRICRICSECSNDEHAAKERNALPRPRFTLGSETRSGGPSSPAHAPCHALPCSHFKLGPEALVRRGLLLLVVRAGNPSLPAHVTRPRMPSRYPKPAAPAHIIAQTGLRRVRRLFFPIPFHHPSPVRLSQYTLICNYSRCWYSTPASGLAIEIMMMLNMPVASGPCDFVCAPKTPKFANPPSQRFTR